MMNEEIEWLCDFLGIPYNNQCTIDVWKATICNYTKIGFRFVNYNIPDGNEQLTIFDYELMEQIAI
ncbi:hypothetical protein KJJ36_15170 [Staphylococcus pseudoxylosus]|uniref:hypothetical protein n=1 Tax=Staphylococcus pseudoxylosus TaxID=2282419 RepID=UPI001F29CABC|nr:hypothetical protein [Staphylococcus pseudoxylosus]MCE5003703.1 hypothetical protein [Staphylococcus pseudoxylosus]